MSSKDINKEALFNEIKGSLFEFLVAKYISQKNSLESKFINSVPGTYVNLLAKQDMMIRSHYPELISSLNKAAKETADEISSYLKEAPISVELCGKMSSDQTHENLGESDILINLKDQMIPVSLKLSKKNSFVNTKSAGIKSFLSNYFPFLDSRVQTDFNRKVDFEFIQMAHELHSLNDLDFQGDFKSWVEYGKSELPGELNIEERGVLKKYYANLAGSLSEILKKAFENHPDLFFNSCLKLMGFNSNQILQVICFHDFYHHKKNDILLNSVSKMKLNSNEISFKSFSQTASVDIFINQLSLQVRIKPMNKFTTTAIKVNCSIKLPNDF